MKSWVGIITLLLVVIVGVLWYHIFLPMNLPLNSRIKSFIFPIGLLFVLIVAFFTEDH